MSCVLQRENGKTLESDFARLSCCCLLSWVMPQAHLENPVIFCVCSFRAFSLCLFPVLCSIMKVFRKNFIIIWLGKMEGLVWVVFFFYVWDNFFRLIFAPAAEFQQDYVLVAVAVSQKLSSTSSLPVWFAILHIKHTDNRPRTRICCDGIDANAQTAQK